MLLTQGLCFFLMLSSPVLAYREFRTQSYSQELSQTLRVHTKKRKSREGWEEGREEREGETDFCIVFGFREAGCSGLSLHLQNPYGYPNHLASSSVNEVMLHLHKTHNPTLHLNLL